MSLSVICLIVRCGGVQNASVSLQKPTRVLNRLKMCFGWRTPEKRSLILNEKDFLLYTSVRTTLAWVQLTLISRSGSISNAFCLSLSWACVTIKGVWLMYSNMCVSWTSFHYSRNLIIVPRWGMSLDNWVSRSEHFTWQSLKTQRKRNRFNITCK